MSRSAIALDATCFVFLMFGIGALFFVLAV